MTKKIIGIWAQDENAVIGKNHILPWHLPAELQHFKKTTVGHNILMGRITFDGMGKRALPNRLSLVLTRDTSYTVDHDRVLVFNSVEEILSWYAQQDKHLFVIGGKQLFQLFESHLDRLIRTDIHKQYDGDTYFPSEFNWSNWEEKEAVFHDKDSENEAAFTVRIFEKKEN
ncbi:dihydrofolate reductase [Streptococcus cameli]